MCGLPYMSEQRYLNRGQGLTCSRACGSILAGRKRTVKRVPNVACAYCGSEFYKRPAHFAGSKSGMFFCSREHKDAAQRLGGVKEIMPSHYGTAKVPEYRKLAFLVYEHRCADCGWDKYPDVLEVNHINCDRSDNSIENLELLCPTCHRVFHYLDGSGPWAK